jgi:hypothetical protein
MRQAIYRRTSKGTTKLCMVNSERRACAFVKVFRDLDPDGYIWHQNADAPAPEGVIDNEPEFLDLVKQTQTHGGMCPCNTCEIVRQS